jgi:hypothetical protein
MHDPVRECARAGRIVARQHELLRARQCTRREREQRLLRRGMPVEDVHVVDDDERRARQLVEQQSGGSRAHREGEPAEELVRREKLRRPHRIAQRGLPRHRVREMRLAEPRTPCQQDGVVQRARRDGRSGGGGIRCLVASADDELRKRVPWVERGGHARS